MQNAIVIPIIKKKLSRRDFEVALRSLERYYHIHHPLHIKMHRGELNQKQIQAWVVNRFYYQSTIPKKDALILANSDDRAFRCRWRQRVIDHDGSDPEKANSGGIEAWVTLGEACGLNRTDIISGEHVLPIVRFSVDAYLNFVRFAPWQEAVCSSLTELFAPKIHQQRLDGWPEKYPFIDLAGLQYFRNRLKEASRDVEEGLAIVLDEFNTVELQNRALQVVKLKLDILWSMADAIHLAYVINLPPYHTCND